MAFNWFNRQFNQSSSDSPPPSEDTPPVQPEPETAGNETPTEAPPAIAEDYLSWAKAAYQNIQKRQQEKTQEEAPSPEEVVSEAAPPEAEPIAEPAAEPTPESVAEASSEPVSLAEESPAEPSPLQENPDPEVSLTSEVEPIAESIPANTETEAEVTPPLEEPTPAPALPFWAQAEAERQERLERLKAEAIETEEQQAPPSRAAESTGGAEPSATPESGEFLDESFVWSAKVLAAQGRRPDQVDIEEITWLKRLRQGLDKTRRNLINQLKAIVGQGPLNQDAVMEIETLLLQADVGVEATDHIIESLQSKLRQEVLPPEEAIAYLKQLLRDMLEKPYQTYQPTFAPEKDTLNIWLITGVNGAGKTTTIGKIAHVASKSGYRCLIGAADTFRAAAVQQVKVWGERSNVEVIANPGKNTDPAAVVFDAITSAQSRDTELLLIDTAGRLQNKKNLMDELSKVRRIIDKKAPDARIESLLVLDATLGQNGLRQAEVFSEVAQLTGVILTKLDGTAKGGIALAVVQQLGLPIRFIGAGEGIEDLRPFSSYEFVEALLSG